MRVVGRGKGGGLVPVKEERKAVSFRSRQVG